MLRRLAIVLSVTLLAACATGTQIKDFGNRSLGYGWLDIKEVDANRLHAVTIYQFRPVTDEPYYPTTVKAFKNGYLYYSMVLPNGAHKTVSASGQRCLGFLCSNTIYTYSFGKQGDEVGAIVIKSPGVYNMGSYKLRDVKTGFFEQGKFDAIPAVNAPSRRELLEEILKDAQDVPVVAARIRTELGQMR